VTDTILALGVPLITAVAAFWTVGVFVFRPRLERTVEKITSESFEGTVERTVERAVTNTVNGKIDRVEAKVDRIQADAEKRFRDVDLRDAKIHTRFEVQIERVSHLADEIERLRG
jgi:hypothetical protein